MSAKKDPKTRKRTRPAKSGKAYRQLWRVVEGAVSMTFEAHPEYLTERGVQLARVSVTKRVVGAVMCYAGEKS